MNIEMGSKTALIAGGTGLVGGYLLDRLLDDPVYDKVIAVTRKPIEGKGNKLVNLVVDFHNLDQYAGAMKADDVFCCLGTTMKKAGGKEEFYKVDHDYPLQLAQLTKHNGARQYLLISSLGADKGSVAFYNRVKGEVEEDIGREGFAGFHVLRPALLMGPREEARSGEDAAKSFFKVFSFLFVGPLKKYKAIDAAQVARAMQAIAHKNQTGQHIYESKELQNF